MTKYHLAQMNLGFLKLPFDDPKQSEFANALDPIYAIAETSPGFVWRLHADDGKSSAYVPVPGLEDPLWVPNLSVWTDLDSILHFVHRSGHAAYHRRRREWFAPPPRLVNVLWWIPVGTIPTIHDAARRLEHLEQNGPSQEGWGIADNMAPPD